MNELLRKDELVAIPNPGPTQRTESVYDDRAEQAIPYRNISQPSGNNPAESYSAVATVPGAGHEFTAPAITAPASESTAEAATLLSGNELGVFRTRWDDLQTSFVDEPREAVSKADALVASVVQRIAEQSASEREKLEKQWDRGDDVSTEDLRQTLKRYRSFLDRLLKF